MYLHVLYQMTSRQPQEVFQIFLLLFQFCYTLPMYAFLILIKFFTVSSETGRSLSIAGEDLGVVRIIERISPSMDKNEKRRKSPKACLHMFLWLTPDTLIVIPISFAQPVRPSLQLIHLCSSDIMNKLTSSSDWFSTYLSLRTLLPSATQTQTAFGLTLTVPTLTPLYLKLQYLYPWTKVIFSDFKKA